MSGVFEMQQCISYLKKNRIYRIIKGFWYINCTKIRYIRKFPHNHYKAQIFHNISLTSKVISMKVTFILENPPFKNIFYCLKSDLNKTLYVC